MSRLSTSFSLDADTNNANATTAPSATVQVKQVKKSQDASKTSAPEAQAEEDQVRNDTDAFAITSELFNRLSTSFNWGGRSSATDNVLGDDEGREMTVEEIETIAMTDMLLAQGKSSGKSKHSIKLKSKEEKSWALSQRKNRAKAEKEEKMAAAAKMAEAAIAQKKAQLAKARERAEAEVRAKKTRNQAEANKISAEARAASMKLTQLAKARERAEAEVQAKKTRNQAEVKQISESRAASMKLKVISQVHKDEKQRRAAAAVAAMKSSELGKPEEADDDERFEKAPELSLVASLVQAASLDDDMVQSVMEKLSDLDQLQLDFTQAVLGTAAKETPKKKLAKRNKNGKSDLRLSQKIIQTASSAEEFYKSNVDEDLQWDLEKAAVNAKEHWNEFAEDLKEIGEVFEL